MKVTKEQTAITLIALVITIIVLLILAGVALASLLGNGSIIDNANYAVGEYNRSANSDENVLNNVEGLFAQYLEGDAEYRIVYYANGGTGTMDEEEASRTGTSTFTPPEGKVFREWNTAADGSGTSYAAGAKVPSDVTLYAIWVSEEIQAQYGNLVADEEEIHQDYFRYQVITEPSVSVVRNTPKQDGIEGVVSRGDTPAVTTQKGTAKILGIDWGYFIPGLSEYYTTGNLTGSGSFITTQAQATEMQEKLKKLVVPYEVTLNDKVYTITEFTIPVIPANSRESWVFDGRMDSYTDGYYNRTYGVDYFIPILARNIFVGSESADYESSIIIPNSVSSVLVESDSKITIPRNHIILPQNANFNRIVDYSFCDMQGLQSITIPNSVTEIGKEAFRNCYDLSTVTMSKNIQTIGNHAFSDCYELEILKIPNTIKTIGLGAFEDCYKLVNIEIPNGVETIGEDAFYSCDKLTSIEIPSSVETIGDSAFGGCDGLTSVTFKGSITSLGNWTFSGCRALTNFTLEGNTNEIGKGVFSNCTALTTITIPSDVTSIGGAAFRDCTALKTITYKGVTYKKIQNLINALNANHVTIGVHQWTDRDKVVHNDGAFLNVALEEDV